MSEQATIKFGVDGVSQALAQILSLKNGFLELGKAVVPELIAATSIAGAVAGLNRLEDQFHELNLEVEKGMRLTGQAAGDMAALELAAKSEGVGFDELSHSLAEFGKWLVDTGQGSRDVNEALLEQADIFKKIGEGATATALARERFGRSGDAMLPLLFKGSSGLKELIDQERLFTGVTQESVEEAKKGEKAWADLKASTSSFFGAWKDDFAEKIETLATGVAVARAVVFGVGAERTGGQGPTADQMAKPDDSIRTKGQLEQQNKILDITRQKFELAVAQAQLDDKGLEANSSYQVQLNAIAGEQEVIAAKRDNNAEALKNLAITQSEFDLSEIAAKKELLALEQKRQAVEQTDISVSEKMAALDIEALHRSQTLLQSDFTKTADEKRSGTFALLRQESERIKQEIDLLTELKGFAEAKGETSAIPVYNAAQEDLTKQKSGVDFQIAQKQSLPDPKSWADQMNKMMADIQDKWTSWAQKIASSFEETLNTAIDSVSQNFSKVLLGTEAWKTAMYQIGQSIMTGIVQSIIKMGIEWLINLDMMVAKWIVGQITMSAASVGARQTVMASNVAASTTEAAAAAPNALLHSIETFGVAAIIGAAAFAIAMAATGSFAEGGYTGGGGKYDVAGVVHAGEFVMPADATQRLGVPYLDSLRSGSGSGAPANVGAGDMVHHINVFDDRSAMNRHIKNNSDIQHTIIDLVARNSHRIISRRA